MWDNDRRHLSTVMRAMIETRLRSTVFRLSSYAPELDPAETGWSPRTLCRAVRSRTLCSLVLVGPRDRCRSSGATKLKRMRYRSGLLDGFVTQTGFIIEPP
ncbi:hypothetical protein [Streptosporangium roseum]|uniref:hypothetical protein n=1 Tax=Streptosporangium roseum TaxID=2001 RepID=UPI0012DEA6CD|nr:hypothetical protein [Streptosporangium roseum]